MSQQGEIYYLAPTTQDLYTVPPDLLHPLGTPLEVNYNHLLDDIDDELDELEYQNYVDTEIDEIEREELEQQFRESIYDESVSNEILNHVKWDSRFKRWGHIALALSLVGTANAAPYLGDVRINMADADQAKSSVIEVYPALEGDTSNNATIFYDGFNTYGAYNLANKLEYGVQQALGGEGWSVQYNNAILDVKKLGDIVDAKLEKNPSIDGIDIVTHSMGDIPGIHYAVEKTNNSWVPIETVTIIAGPADYDTLTDHTKHELGIPEHIAWIPWIEYSTVFRYALEMYFYEQDLRKDPFKTISGINRRFSNGNITSNLFLSSQIKAISSADVPENILETDPNPDKFQTVYNVVQLTHDTVVENDEAADKICEAVLSNGNPCNRFTFEYGGHGDYYKKNVLVEYEKLFAKIAEVNKPQVAREKARHALNLYGVYGEDTFISH